MHCPGGFHNPPSCPVAPSPLIWQGEGPPGDIPGVCSSSLPSVQVEETGDPGIGSSRSPYSGARAFASTVTTWRLSLWGPHPGRTPAAPSRASTTTAAPPEDRARAALQACPPRPDSELLARWP